MKCLFYHKKMSNEKLNLEALVKAGIAKVPEELRSENAKTRQLIGDVIVCCDDVERLLDVCITFYYVPNQVKLRPNVNLVTEMNEEERADYDAFLQRMESFQTDILDIGTGGMPLHTKFLICENIATRLGFDKNHFANFDDYLKLRNRVAHSQYIVGYGEGSFKTAMFYKHKPDAKELEQYHNDFMAQHKAIYQAAMDLLHKITERR